MTARRFVIAPELATLLAAAFLLRLAVFYLAPNIHWPDEIYQATEPAHRLVFGTGAVSWEWLVGARSWLLPGALAGLMELGRAIGDTPAAINLPIAIFMAAMGCVPAACGYGWGRQFFGRAGGFAAASVPAIWVDLLYLSVHPLSEVLAADCLVAALYLGLPMAEQFRSRHRLWAAGAMLGLTFALRYHLGPALLIAAIGMCGVRGSYTRWRAVVGGASAPVLFLGLLDWITFGAPFQSIAFNLWFNIEQSGAYAGRQPFGTLIVLPFYLWGGACAVVLFTALMGARRLIVPFVVAIAIFATYSLTAHKEYRFIFPALTLLAVLAGIGAADLLHMLAEARPNAFSSARIPAMLAAIFWLTTSSAIALSPVYHESWTRARAHVEAFADVSHRADPCGVGLYGIKWAITPGNSGLPPRVGLYQTDRAHLGHDAAAFNYIVAREKAPVPDPRYRREACFAGDAGQMHVCVWHRAGGCDASAGPSLPANWPRTLTGNRPEPIGDPPWLDQPDEH